MVGVSPAYFISRYGEGFTPQDIAASLPDIAAIGGQAYQLELFREQGSAEWTPQAIADIKEAEKKAGIRASQFVAHCLLHGFADPASLTSDRGIGVFARIVDICTAFSTVSAITVPLPPFAVHGIVAPDDWKAWRTALAEKLGRLCSLAGEKGYTVALELVPGNILGSPEMILGLRALRGLETLGYNYDTGHAWACRERVELLPAKLSGLIYGTHLKDNTQEAPLALAPGKGTIPWDLVLGGLRSAGYAGSWDVEFMCPSAEVQEAYRGGIAKIKDTLNAQGAEQHG